MWDLSSRPGIEPASPALESGFFTTGPPGKSPTLSFIKFHDTTRSCFFFFFSFFFSWPHRVACRILVLQPGIESRPMAGKVPSPNHWIPREFPIMLCIRFAFVNIYSAPPAWTRPVPGLRESSKQSRQKFPASRATISEQLCPIEIECEPHM